MCLWAWYKLNCEVMLLLCVALCVVRSVDMCDSGLAVNGTVKYCCYGVLRCVLLDLLIFKTVGLV